MGDGPYWIMLTQHRSVRHAGPRVLAFGFFFPVRCGFFELCARTTEATYVLAIDNESDAI
jgi:hypothetical protein